MIEVDKLYVDVYLLEKLTNKSYATIPDLLQGANLRDDFNRLGIGQREPRSLGVEVAANYPRLMVLGKLGSGKSTFLRYLAVVCCQDEFQVDYIPILIELRDIKDTNRFDLQRQNPSGVTQLGLGSSEAQPGKPESPKRTMPSLALYQLMPVVHICSSKRRKARIANPIWLRCARLARTEARSAPQHCLSSLRVLLNRPSKLTEAATVVTPQVQVIGCPVINVTVWGD